MERNEISKRIIDLRFSGRKTKSNLQNRLPTPVLYNAMLKYDYESDVSYLILQTVNIPQKVTSANKNKYSNLVMSVEQTDNSLTIYLGLKKHEFVPPFSAMVESILSTIDLGYSMLEIVELINHWERFFAKDKFTLSEEEIKGLIGELLFLKMLLESGFTESNAVNAWNGPNDATHDFELQNISVEIKTTSDNRVKISSEFQLDAQADLPLYLTVFTFSIGGTPVSIVQLREQIMEQLSEDTSILFTKKLENYGYFHAMHEPKEGQYTYTVSGIHTYSISDEFPKIIRPQLDEHIIDVEYTLDLSNLNRLRIGTQQLIDSQVEKNI